MRFTVAIAALTLAACNADSPDANATVNPAAAGADQTYPKTLVFAGMPPPRFRGNRIMILSTGTVRKCGESSVPNTHFAACTRDEFIVHTANPCDYPDEVYATRVCHEKAHLNGWPVDHGP